MTGRLPHRRALARLIADASAAALTEFALLFPVFIVLLMGAFDAGHTLYMFSVLQGAVQKAGRDSGLQTGIVATTEAAIDQKVANQVKVLNHNATVTFTRKYYKSFTATSATKEQYTDTDNDGTCDHGEPYVDDNNDSTWDNAGTTGGGDARDTVVYTATVTYPRMFPVAKLIGLSNNVTLTATTILNNQPFGDQQAATIRNCP